MTVDERAETEPAALAPVQVADVAQAPTAAATPEQAPNSEPAADSPRRHLWGEEPQASALARFLDDLYGVLFSPRATFEDLAAKPPAGMAIILYILILAVDGIASLPTLRTSLDRLAMGHLLSGMARFLSPFFLVLTILGWILSAAVLHLVAEWLGGHGRATDLFTLGAFYRVPELFLAPLTLVAALTVPRLTGLFSLLLQLWSLVLAVCALRANYRFGTGRAVGVLLLPAAAGVVVIVILAASAALAAAPFVSGLLGR